MMVGVVSLLGLIESISLLGKLAGCLSLSDLRILGSDFSSLHRVYATVEEFLQNKDQANSHPGEKKRPDLLFVTNDSTVTQVSRTFVSNP
jgi:hypothetical protein